MGTFASVPFLGGLIVRILRARVLISPFPMGSPTDAEQASRGLVRVARVLLPLRRYIQREIPHYVFLEVFFMKRLICVAAGAACTALLSAAPAHAARLTAANSGYVPTATRAFLYKNATFVKTLPPNTALRLNVGLQVRNAAALRNLVQAEHTPGNSMFEKSITPAQFVSAFGPTTAQVSAVTGYLAHNGFSNISVEPNHLMISANATAAQASSAFATGFAVYKLPTGAVVYGNTAGASVPSALGGTVLSVLGLNNGYKMQTHIQKCTVGSGPACVRFYDPPTFWKAYNVGTVTTGKITPIAIFAEGNLSSVLPDLRLNEKTFGLPQSPYSIVHVGLPSPDTAGVDEWDLDTQYSSGMAGYVNHLYVYDTTSLTDSDIALEFNRFVTQNIAKAGNASFGECEVFPYIDGSMVLDDEIFNEGAAQGQTIFSSTGDTGAMQCSVGNPNGVPVGAPNVEYPATSPYVVAVGGTDLFTDTNANYLGETAWESGGGGISAFEYSPYWQNCPPGTTFCPSTAPIVPSNAAGMKGNPDISMDAALETGALVYIGGQQFIVGGTSLSSPLAEGVWARMMSAHANELGFASPDLYSVYGNCANPPFAPTNGIADAGPPPTERLGGFHDIITGQSGGTPMGNAHIGYDYVTGLGTFDVTPMATDIDVVTDGDRDDGNATKCI